MKTSAMFWVVITTLVLVLEAIVGALYVPFPWIFSIMILGQALVVYMVYRVLTDSYATDKTFAQWYEDHPV